MSYYLGHKTNLCYKGAAAAVIANNDLEFVQVVKKL